MFQVTGATVIHSSRSIGVDDASSRFFPGQYFEQKAQFHLRKKDYREALRLFELSSYWADKVAQYNVGIMYYNGIGAPAEKTRGVAWLGIAAEAHDTLADAALQVAYAELSPEQRKEAQAIFEQLDAKYGDEVTLPRALTRYRQDAAISLFGFGVTGDGTATTYAGTRAMEENSVDFVHRMDAQRDALIAQIRGHVVVGSVQTLLVPDEAKQNASHKVLDATDTQ
jgi:TPR repeat protein